MKKTAVTFNRLITFGTLVALTGYLFSGIFGFLLVQFVHPQPAWVSAAVFAQNYHVVQDIPYYFGLLLIGGMLMLSAGHYLNAKGDSDKDRFHLLLALVWTTAFAVLIFFNYLCQTTFVRHLALNYNSASDPLIATFSMANPMSLAWAIEMWGYGILGVATWLMSNYYTTRNKTIHWLLIANGVVSVLTVIFTIVNMKWLLAPAGITGYFAWNVLMITLMILMYRHSKTSSIGSDVRI